MIRAYQGNLFARICFFVFPPTPNCAYIFAWSGPAEPGQGHNATTVSIPAVVACVVASSPLFLRANPPPTTAQRRNRPISRTCLRLRAHEAIMPLCRCAVVPYLYLIDYKEIFIKRGHNAGHNAALFALIAVVGTVVALANPLKNNKKGGFYVESVQ